MRPGMGHPNNRWKIMTIRLTYYVTFRAEHHDAKTFDVDTIYYASEVLA